MTPKHSLLFSALCITLAFLLLNASIIQVSGVATIVIVGAIIGSIIGGAITGWFAHEWLSQKSKTPGVNLDSYVDCAVDGWEVSVLNMENYVRNIATRIHAAKFYYIRLAEYQAKNYVNYENLEAVESKAMLDIARDLWKIEKSTADGFEYFAEELMNYAKERLTGDLENYDVKLCDSTTCWSLKQAVSIKPVYILNPAGARFKAYIFGGYVRIACHSSGSGDSGEFKLHLLGENPAWYNVTVDDNGWHYVGSLNEGLYEITYEGQYCSGLIEMNSLFIVSDASLLTPAFAVKLNWDQHGIKTGHEFIVKGGQINREILFSNVFSSWLNVLNNLDSVYDAAFDYAKAYHQFLRNMGYTDPSQIPPDMVYPPPDVWLPTLNETFRKYSEKWDEIYARYLALLQQFSKAFNETNYRLVQLWNELNASFADAREKFLNVIIRDINGTLWGIVDILIPLWVSKAQEFYANQTNILKGVIGALVRFQNGTWKYVEIPAGWSITPSSILTPSGLTPSLYLQNWAGGMNPAYTPGNHSQPTYLSSDYAEAVTLTLQLVLGIMPLVLLLAIVNMITRMGRR